MSNFLEVDDSLIQKNLLLNQPAGDPAGDVLGSLFGSGPSSKEPSILTPSDRVERSQAKFIIPIAGICIKTKDQKNGLKFFMNLCHSSDVPEPDFDYPDDKLAEILDSGSDMQVDDIRIPMSIGELHKDEDKSGNECLACDVIINTRFFNEKILKSEMYRTFLTIVAFEGIDEKHKLELEKSSYVVLHNRKSFGKLQPQFVRQKAGIKEIKDTTGSFESTVSTTTSLINNTSKGGKALVQEVSAEDLKLDYTITQVSEELAVAEVKLPNLRVPSKLAVQLGADRIIVDSPNGCLDIFVPLDIHQEESRAEYDPDAKVLKLTLPLVTKI